MSTTIDQQVVEMRFDNSHFERNVQTSMSTLDKLKQKLNLNGASKGLENLSDAAKNNNLHLIGHAADQVSLKFNAMYSATDQVFRNIISRAQHTAESLVKAFTIDPVKTGFSEYETKINSIQTIMSNTASKGTTMEDVTRVIDELNTYADKTIYNFAEMTRNIGTFTAAGVGLEESAAAIQGIANLAAASGSNSQQASTAMYQLSQALAAGTVKLMDWNSVVNAGMGGEKFQEALKATAREHGIAVDEIIEKNGSFRDSLQEGWISADILNTTLNKFTVEGAKAYADSMVKSGKYTKEQADALIKEAQAMEDAATKVKTFTQLMDTLKESVQSGWGKTWEILIGDFEEAKELFSGVSDFLSGFIDKMSDARNNVLEIAMDSPFGKIAEKVQKLSKATEKVTEATKNYGKIVDRVLGGEFGNGQSRWDKLAESGYDWAKVQNMVNEKLGDSTRHTEKLTKAQDKNIETQATTIEQLAKMDDAQLARIGLNAEERKSLRELEKAAEQAGYSLSEVVKNPDLLSGRSLIIEGFKNIGSAIGQVAKAAKDAWQSIFPPKSTEERAEQLYKLIGSFHKLTQSFKMSDETADNLQRTFKGLFALVDIVATLLGGPLKWGFDAVIQLLGKFDIDILETTAKIGDVLVKVRDWIDANNFLVKGLETISPYLKEIADGISDWIKGFKDADNIPKYIIEGLVNGITKGVPLVIEAIIELGKSLILGICDVLGIHSPSVVFYAIGGFIIAGLVAGIIASIPNVIEAMKSFGASFVDSFSNIDMHPVIRTIWEKLKMVTNMIVGFVKDINWGTIVAAGISISFMFMVKKIFDVISMLEKPLNAFGDLLEGVGNALEMVADGIQKNLKAKAFEHRTEGILNIAKAILVLAGAMFLIAKIDEAQLWKAVGVIAVMTIIIGALAFAVSKFNSGDFDFSFAKVAGLVLGIAGSLLIMAGAMKLIASIDESVMKQVMKSFAVMIGGLIAIIATVGIFVNGRNALALKAASKMVMKISFAMLLMVGVIKLASTINRGDIEKGVFAVGALSVFFIAIIGVSKLVGKNADKAGSMMIKMSIALGLMIGVIKLAAQLSPSDLRKGSKAVIALGLLFGGLALVTRLASKDSPKIGGTLIAISTAMLLMIGITKIASKMSTEELIKGGIAVAALSVIIVGLIAATRLAGNNAPRIGVTLLAISVAIGILAAISVMLGFVNTDHLKKGIIAVGSLGIIMALMVRSTKGAEKCVGNLVVMTVAIVALVSAVAALSLIETDKLVPAVAALVLILGTFALVLKSASTLQSSITSLIIMTVAVGLLGGLLYLLADLPVENTLAVAASLSLLLISISASLKIIVNVGATAYAAIPAVAMMGLVVGALGIILGLILARLTKLEIDLSIETVASLSILLVAMSGVLAVLSAIGIKATGAIPATASLVAVVGIIGAAVLAIGELMSLIPEDVYNDMMSGLDRFIALFEKIAYGLGSVIGNLAGGFIDGVASCLPALGEHLSGFMKNAKGFIDGCNDIDSGTVLGASSLAGAILAITAANVISSIVESLPWIPSMADMGTQLSAFMTNAQGFITGIGDVKPEHAEAAANLGKMILAISAANILDGISKFIGFSEEGSLATFGSQLPAFGTAMADFSNEVKGIDTKAVESAASAGQMLADLNNKLPNSGGKLAEWIGDNTWETFGAGLTEFGTAMATFANSVKGIDTKAVENAAAAGMTLAELNNNIPNSGGKLAEWIGDNTLDTFGAQLKLFGEAIVTFSSTVDGKVSKSAVKNAASAGQLLADLNNTLPSTGGKITTWFMGDNSLGTFGTNIEKFGSAMVAFSNEITQNGGISDEAVTAASKAGLALAEVQKSIPEDKWLDGKISIDDFGKKIKSYGEKVKDYSDEVKKIDVTAVEASLSASKTLVSIVRSVASLEKIDVEPFEKIVDIGENIKTYSEKVADIDTSVVTGSVSIAMKLVTLIQGMIGLDSTGVSAFNLESIGKNIESYADHVGNINPTNVISSIVACRELVDFIRSTAGLDANGVAEFVSGVANLGTVSLEAIINSFGEATATLNETGANLMRGFVSGIQSGIPLLAPIAATFIPTITSAIYSNSGQLSEAATVISNAFKSIIDNSIGGLKLSGSNMINAIIEGVKSKQSGLTTLGNGLDELVKKGVQTSSLQTIGVDMTSAIANGMKSKQSTLVTIGNGFDDLIKKGIQTSTLQTIGVTMITAIINGVKSKQSTLVTISNGFDELIKKGVSTSAFSNIGIDMMTAITNGMKSKQNGLVTLGNEMDDLVKKGVSMTSLKTIGSDMATCIKSGFESKKSTLTNTAKNVIAAMSNTIDGKKSTFKSDGASLGENLADGLKSKRSSVVTAAVSGISDAIDDIQEYRSSFESAGRSLANGFADGISENSYKAAAKARAMAAAAVEAAREELDINSPSKVFRSLGYSIPEGLAAGIDKCSYWAKESAVDMADGVINNVRDAISAVSDFVNSDIDTQPTIRPVLDLSDVETGMNAISGLLNSDAHIGASANVRMVSAMMNQNGQNGSDEIVTAINKLRKDLGNVGGTSYNINGITYDDGSNISEAVKTITRHAKLARRT